MRLRSRETRRSLRTRQGANPPQAERLSVTPTPLSIPCREVLSDGGGVDLLGPASSPKLALRRNWFLSFQSFSDWDS